MTPLSLDRAVDAVLRITDRFDIQFVSEAGKRWLAQFFKPSLPRNFLDFIHADEVPLVRQAMLGAPDSFNCDVRIGREGNPCWVNFRCQRLSTNGQYVMTMMDISSWKTEATSLRHAAEHDDLTGLPNRGALKRAVANCIESSDDGFIVALMDLDGFKRVNDTLGHQAGDAVLVETTRRLLKVLGPQDILARLGGDEFVILFPGKSLQSAIQVLKAVLIAVARPFQTAPHNAYLGVSIGIAEYPQHGDDYSTLLKNADTAMYQSKNAGKNRISVFAHGETSPGFSITSAMHKGIQEGEFYLEYQPQFDMNRQLVGAEALMRWENRKLGTVGPNVFIPIAESAGLMPFLGSWALRSACHQLKQFQSLCPDFVMSVNVSALQFDCDHFDQQVINAIQEAGIDPRSLILEITESTLLLAKDKTEQALHTLRERGVRFSIDDFGTGFSSLSYLTRLPVSSIKIDKAFVWAIAELHDGPTPDKQLISAMINLGQSIDLRVVAEGVENDTQFDFLKAAGCDLIQGFLLGHPMSAQAICRHLLRQMEMAA
jgi:diguanylate cyclase (GGDEF)-like protein